MSHSRSRSSTVSSQRSPVPSAHQPLHSPSPSHSQSAATDLAPYEEQQQPFAPKSYNSLHSLKTLRGGADGGGSSGETSPPRGDMPSRGRRAGPQFVIDLDGGSAPRPRSATFGGVELPPSREPATASRSEDRVRVTDRDSYPSDRDDDNGGDDNDDDEDKGRKDLLPLSRPLLSQRGRTASVSSLSSLRSLDPALHLGGAPLRERRPVLYAGLQAGAILVASVLGLYLALKLALPPIDPGDRDKVRLPKSFDDLKELNEVLQVRSLFWCACQR